MNSASNIHLNIEEKRLHLNCIACGKCWDEKVTFHNDTFKDCVFSLFLEDQVKEINHISFYGRGLHFTRDDIELLRDIGIFSKYLSRIGRAIQRNCLSRCPKPCLVKELNLAGVSSPRKALDLLDRLHAELVKLEKIACRTMKGRLSKIESPGLSMALKRFLLNPKGENMVSRLDVHFLGTGSKRMDRSLELKNKSTEKKDLVKEYRLERFPGIKIEIHSFSGQIERKYIFSQELACSNDLLNYLVDSTRKLCLDQADYMDSMEFNTLYEMILRNAQAVTSDLNKVRGERNLELVVQIITFSILGLEKLFVFLVDDHVNEIFLDSPNSRVYINHGIVGRCSTDVQLTLRDIEIIKTRFRQHTSKYLNEANPSLKCTIRNELLNIRVAIDIAPFNFNGFSLDIRKLHENYFDLLVLIENGTLPPKLAAFLVTCLHFRKNILIAGRTDSGKTTLMNALDCFYPPHFRKIYVEDVLETRYQDEEGHQLKLVVDNGRDKINTITTLLHRSPDVLILGEILTREECLAMFHCFTVGLTGLQTVHARSTRSLLNRFLTHFNIPRESLGEIDYIVLMKKYENGQRKVVEVSRVQENSTTEIEKIVMHEPSTGNWKFNDEILFDGTWEFSRLERNVKERYFSEIHNAFLKHSGDIVACKEACNQVFIKYIEFL